MRNNRIFLRHQTIQALNFLNGWNDQQSAEHITILFDNYGTTLEEIHADCTARLTA